MIAELRIVNLGVIEEAVLELGPGLTVITGETGAGKTMVVTALGLLLGGRADPGAVRRGGSRALVEGRLALPEGHPVLARAREAGGEPDEDGTLLLAREVRSGDAGGRSRAWVGGRTVPVTVLTELAEELVAVHGQSDQLRLLRPAVQRDALDRFGGAPLGTALARYQQLYAELYEVESRLAELTAAAQQRAREADLLRFGLGEVEAAAPLPGEDVALAAEADRLRHADALRAATAQAHEALLGDPERVDGPSDALALLVAARRSVEEAAAVDPALVPLAERLAELATLIADVGADLSAYLDGVDADPARLAVTEERRAVLAGLVRKYGDGAATAATGVDAVLAWADLASRRLLELDGDDDRRGELAHRSGELRALLGPAAAELTAARGDAALRFGEAVTSELRTLAMPDAQVHATVRQREVVTRREGEPPGTPAGDGQGTLDLPDGRRVLVGPHGADEVELLLTPHPGATPRPLGKGASGGELSRLMLAVEVVFAAADPVPTFVFDEVDAGVGGRAAVELGARLARLAATAQVLVVTHLPQVAAFADRHLVVTKASDGQVTRSGVALLDAAGRPQELARMLAGLDGSTTGLAHAEELLAAAEARSGERHGTTKRPTARRVGTTGARHRG